MRLAEAATLLGVSKHTLARWEREGKVACHKTANERRFYTTEDLQIIRRTMKLGTKLEKPRVAQSKPQQAPQTRHKPHQALASEPQRLEIDWNAFENLDDTGQFDFVANHPDQQALIQAAPYEDLRSRVAYMVEIKVPLNSDYFPGITRPNYDEPLP